MLTYNLYVMLIRGTCFKAEIKTIDLFNTQNEIQITMEYLQQK